MSSKLEPVIRSRDTGHIGKHGGVDGRTLPNDEISRTDGLPYFLPMMLRARNLGARSPAKIEKGLFALLKVANFNLKKFALLFQLPYFIGLQSTVYPYMVKGADFFHFLNLPNFTGKPVIIVNVSIHPSLNRSFLCSSVCLFGFLFL